MTSKKLSKNIIIYGLSNGIKSLVPFIMLPVLTSYISAKGYGILSIVETSILFLAPFLMINIGSFISVEYYKVSKDELSKYISNGIFLSLISFIIVFILLFVFKDFTSSLIGIPIKLVLLIPIFVMLRIVPTIVLVLFQMQQRAVNFLYFNFLQTIFDFVLSALFIIVFKFGYIGRLEGTYFAFFIFSIIGSYLIYRMGYFKFSISKKRTNEILKFGIPLIPHVIGGTTIAMSDRYFISHFEGNSNVGIYAVAYQIGALLLLFSRSVNQAWTPMLFELLNKKNINEAKKITTILFIIFIIVGGLVYFFSDVIFEVLVNKSFYEAKKYFPMLLLGFMFQSLYFLFVNFIFYSKKTVLLASITFSGAFLNLMLNYKLIKSYGTIGVAYATAITWFVFFVATYLFYKFKILKTCID